MLNFCYIYSFLWSSVLFLYSLGWSDLCVPLDKGLLAFFVITIVVSLIIGVLFKENFCFSKMDKYPDRSNILTLVIIFLSLVEYLVCAQIPLFSILTKSRSYTSFTGIPTFHTVLSTFASFYAQYIFYLFVCFPEKRKKLFLEYLSIITVVFLFQFNRGQLLINLYISVALLLSSLKRKIGLKHIVALIFGTVIVLYVFGGLGNLRSGFGWNDSWYIEYIGKYNSNYPSWLPKQFMWSYSYITSPLANLNYNITSNNTNDSFIGTLISLVPDFICKRLFPAYASQTPQLMVPYFNVTAAFGKAYLWGDYAGMIMYYIMLIIGQITVLYIFKIKDCYKMPLLGTMSGIVAFTFFAHTLSYSAISFIAIFPLITVFSLDRIPKLKKLSRL